MVCPLLLVRAQLRAEGRWKRGQVVESPRKREERLGLQEVRKRIAERLHLQREPEEDDDIPF